MNGPTTGDLLTLEIGAVGSGGVCVARHNGQVVFVRHTLPGERVRARVTGVGGGGSFLRADAVDIEVASPDRVESRCPAAGPGGCGGCDWQHATLDAQRRGKAELVVEQFRRFAGIDVSSMLRSSPSTEHASEVAVTAVAGLSGEVEGLGWRTRVRFTAATDGRLGFHRWHQRAVVPVAECPLAHPGIRALGLPTFRWPGGVEVEAAMGDSAPDDAPLVIVSPPAPPDQRHGRRGRRNLRPAATAGSVVPQDLPVVAGSLSIRPESGAAIERVRGRSWVRHRVRLPLGEREFRVTGGGFWQGHPAAAQTLVDAVLRLAGPKPGDHAVDLYSGVGLFASALGESVGSGGQVIAVEGDSRAVADARRNLHGLPQVQLETAEVGEWIRAGGLARVLGPDLVVLDPPRRGAGPETIVALAATGARLVYVACDPAPLARDVAAAISAGYHLVALEAFDLFPMTHHVECVAVLEPVGE